MCKLKYNVHTVHWFERRERGGMVVSGCHISGRSSTAHARGLRVDSCLHQLSFFSLAIWKVTAQITSEYIISNGLYTRRVYQQSDFSCFDFAQDCFLCNAMFHVTSCSPCIVLSTLG